MLVEAGHPALPLQLYSWQWFVTKPNLLVWILAKRVIWCDSPWNLFLFNSSLNFKGRIVCCSFLLKMSEMNLFNLSKYIFLLNWAKRGEGKTILVRGQVASWSGSFHPAVGPALAFQPAQADAPPAAASAAGREGCVVILMTVGGRAADNKSKEVFVLAKSTSV